MWPNDPMVPNEPGSPQAHLRGYEAAMGKQKSKSAPKKAKSRPPMSAAARKKLSALMKARWAAKKKSKA